MQCVGKKGQACSLQWPFPNVSWQSGRVIKTFLWALVEITGNKEILPMQTTVVDG